MSRTVIACLVCLLVAGCAAPSATPQTPAPTTAESAGANGSDTARAVEDGYDIAVSGGDLPVDYERTFVRTERLLGANVSPPGVLIVQTQSEIESDVEPGATPSDGSGRSFLAVMGIGQSADDGESDGEDGDDGVTVAAYAASGDAVYVNEQMTAAGRERALERTLAHEFVHTAQFRQDAFRRLQRALDLRERYSRDRYLAYASVIEGVAVYVAAAYDRRYLPGDHTSITGDERYRSADSGVKYAIARYYYGSRYLDRRFNSTRNVSAVYDDPPESTEQLLHNDTDDEPAELSVVANAGPNRTTGQVDVNGELFSRIALGTELNRSQAGAGADGWGTDRLVPVDPEREAGNRSYAWATRWDAPAEADEFERALGEYLASRAERQDGGIYRDGALTFRVERVSPETVVLLAGEEPFVRSASVRGVNESVSVTVKQEQRT